MKAAILLNKHQRTGRMSTDWRVEH